MKATTEQKLDKKVADLAADIAEAFASGDEAETWRVFSGITSRKVALRLAAAFAVGWRDATAWGAELTDSDPSSLMRRYATFWRMASMTSEFDGGDAHGRR